MGLAQLWLESTIRRIVVSLGFNQILVKFKLSLLLLNDQSR